MIANLTIECVQTIHVGKQLFCLISISRVGIYIGIMERVVKSIQPYPEILKHHLHVIASLAMKEHIVKWRVICVAISPVNIMGYASRLI